MQATCPHCSNKIVIDDARVPDRPFSVKCPKCQNALKFPGKAAAEAPAEAGASDELDAPAPPRGPSHEGEHALVCLPEPATASQVAAILARQGYEVETLDDVKEAARQLEQGAFEVVVTAPLAGSPGRESPYQKACRLSPEARRRFFLMLVADDVKSGDGSLAFTMQADLLVNGRDVGRCEGLFRNTLAERTRAFKPYMEARQRHDRESGYR